MQMTVETVRIKSPVIDGNELGFVLINKEDLTDEHELFDKAEGKEAKAAVEAPAPAPAGNPWAK